MNESNDFKEFGRKTLDQWKSMIEEFEVQLALGKAEAKDVFNREKKSLTEFINERKAEFEKNQKKKRADFTDYAVRLKCLKDKVNADYPTAAEGLDEWRNPIMSCVHKTEFMTGNIMDYGLEILNIKLKDLKLTLDNYRVQLALANFENLSELNDNKEALDAALSNALDMVNRIGGDDGTSVRYFMDEISKSFDHLKQAFAELV
ncbi:MAG: hypothetical protein HKN16_07335 [Saprospiraceae bacterium]|nr:hypothetical protein [Saprospiraceae bacterium]